MSEAVARVARELAHYAPFHVPSAWRWWVSVRDGEPTLTVRRPEVGEEGFLQVSPELGRPWVPDDVVAEAIEAEVMDLVERYRVETGHD